MAVNRKINLCLGLTAFVLTFIFSIKNNTWLTSLERAGFGFILFFLLGYCFIFFYRKPSNTIKNTNKTTPLDKSSNSFQPVSIGSLHQTAEGSESEETGYAQNQEGNNR